MQTFKQFLTEESRDKYRARLTRKLKIKKLGSGAYADVFQHPEFPDIAVKAFGEDESYEKYLEWAILHQHNRFVPPIVDWIRVPTDGDGYEYDDEITDIVFFQKLRRATRSEIRAEVIKFADLIDKNISSTFDAFSNSDWRLLSTCKNHDVAEIAEYFYRNRNSLDLHNENIMMHGDQLVFTDPVA